MRQLNPQRCPFGLGIADDEHAAELAENTHPSGGLVRRAKVIILYLLDGSLAMPSKTIGENGSSYFINID